MSFSKRNCWTIKRSKVLWQWNIYGRIFQYKLNINNQRIYLLKFYVISQRIPIYLFVDCVNLVLFLISPLAFIQDLLYFQCSTINTFLMQFSKKNKQNNILNLIKQLLCGLHGFISFDWQIIRFFEWLVISSQFFNQMIDVQKNVRRKTCLLLISGFTVLHTLSKKYVKNDILYIMNYNFIFIFLLDNEPVVSKSKDFMFLLSHQWHTNSIPMTPVWHSLYQIQHTLFESVYKSNLMRMYKYFKKFWYGV